MSDLSRINVASTYKLIRKLIGGVYKLVKDCCCAIACSYCGDPEDTPQIVRVEFDSVTPCHCVDGSLALSGTSSAYQWTSGTLGTYDLHIASASNPADSWVPFFGGAFDGCSWCYRDSSIETKHYVRQNNTNVDCTMTEADGVTTIHTNNDLMILFKASEGLVRAWTTSANGPVGAPGQVHALFVGDTSLADCPTTHSENNTLVTCDPGTPNTNDMATGGTADVTPIF